MAGDNKASGFQMKAVDHIGFVVKDVETVMEAWSAMLGVGPWTVHETEGKDGEGNPFRVKLAFAYLGELELELIEPAAGKFLHADYLAEVGEGIHHLGIAVEDVEAETAKMVAAGAETILHSPGAYSYQRFAEDGGVIFELMNKLGIDQRRKATKG
jgi:methylmalonyl-CoA/ethylmalonyl-CoA epimerase